MRAVSGAGCICFEVSGNSGGCWSGLNAPWEIGGWIESCATGPDQVNIGAPRRAVGTAKGPLGGRETMDAEVALVRSLVLMLMLMLASVLAEDAGVGDIYLQYGTYWKVSPAVTVVRQTTARMRSDLVSLGKRWAK